MKRFISTVLICLSFCACSYMSPVKDKPTNIRLEVSDIKGTQVALTATPDDDRVYYMTGVIAARYLDSLQKVFSDTELVQLTVDSLMNRYSRFRNYYESLGQIYIADFNCQTTIYGEFATYIIGLSPETDYYAVAFCLDSITHKLMGNIIKQPFRTTKIVDVPSKMILDYMIYDDAKAFYVYCKPTLYGKICKEPYLMNMASDQEIADSGGLQKYAEKYYMKCKEDGTLPRLLLSDISRRGYTEYMHKKEMEGKDYTVLGIPFNSTNFLSGNLFTYHFKYTPGMSTKYTHTIN